MRDFLDNEQINQLRAYYKEAKKQNSEYQKKQEAKLKKEQEEKRQEREIKERQQREFAKSQVIKWNNNLISHVRNLFYSDLLKNPEIKSRLIREFIEDKSLSEGWSPWILLRSTIKINNNIVCVPQSIKNIYDNIMPYWTKNPNSQEYRLKSKKNIDQEVC